MNRAIKFEIWCVEEKVMYRSSQGELKLDGDIWSFWKGGKCVANSKDDFLRQFTGLFDKNNKEIYEGDILEDICTDDGTKLHYIVEIGKSKDNRYGFKLRHIDNSDSCIALLVELASLEILGNKFENLNLLK